MVFSIDNHPDIRLRRLARPALLLVLTLLAVAVCVLGTIHVFTPVLTGT